MPGKVISNNKRMAKNTVLMYIRMLVLIIVQLYTVPVVLRALGVEDYGIYNVVGGFVAMFTFVNGSLISGCQRFMAYAIGQKDDLVLKRIFDTSVFVFVMLALFLFLILEGIGIWFLNSRMNIPAERMVAANWVLQFSILSLMVTVCATPFNSAVIAHEQMSVYAYLSIFESLYKLLIAFAITVVLIDKMIVYAILLFTSSLIVGIIYFYYSRKHFVETRRIKLRWDPAFLKDITSYAGWNMIGALAIMFRNHGLNILMNLFFTPVMNAAHTLASHISGLFTQFINNVYIATRPQITKQYAAGNIDQMWDITYRSSKYAFYLMCYIAIPCLIELPAFLKIWLHDVPDYTVLFSRMMIISLLLDTITNQLIGVFQAENKIKYYQTVSSVILLSVVPLSYCILQIVANPILPYLTYVGVTVAYVISLIVVARKRLNLNLPSFLREVVCKDLIVFVPSFVAVYLVVHFFYPSYLRILLTIGATLLIPSCFIWLWGVDEIEKNAVRNIIGKFMGSVTKRWIK